MCKLLETSRDVLQPLPTKEILSKTAFNIKKLKVSKSNQELQIFTEVIRPLCKRLLSELDQNESQLVNSSIIN